MQALKPPSSLPILAIFIILTSSFNPSYSTELCNPSDKAALLEIQTHFESSESDTWNASTDCCKDWTVWYANVKCNSDGRVTDIYIQATINGPVPSAFGLLPYLQTLTVWPSMTGVIPNSFFNLVNLQHLDLSLNQLSGPIPEFLGRLKQLTYLDLGNNGGFNGSIPSSLAQLQNLKYLYLYNNKLTGSIPEFMSRMTSLVELNLAGNSLTGSIPPGLSNLFRLTTLNLVHNYLTGLIPDTFDSFKPNMTLLLTSNILSGRIPRSLDRVNFRELNFRENKLTGDASFLFTSDKTMLTTIDVSYNRLKFDFSNIDLSQSIKDLDISHNMIYGSLPKRLGQLPLRRIDVSYNRLCGQIPNGRRLKLFKPDGFDHNKCLCGPPLPPCKS